MLKLNLNIIKEKIEIKSNIVLSKDYLNDLKEELEKEIVLEEIENGLDGERVSSRHKYSLDFYMSRVYRKPDTYERDNQKILGFSEEKATTSGYRPKTVPDRKFQNLRVPDTSDNSIKTMKYSHLHSHSLSKTFSTPEKFLPIVEPVKVHSKKVKKVTEEKNEYNPYSSLFFSASWDKEPVKTKRVKRQSEPVKVYIDLDYVRSKYPTK